MLTLSFLMDSKKIFSKQLYVLIAVVVVVAVLGIAYFALRSNAATVVEGDNVSVYYTGTLTNGTEFGSNVGGQPLQFTVGSNNVIPGFSEGIIGMKINETKQITIPANEAYGPVNQALIISVPISAFENRTVVKGMVVSENTTNGPVSGVVTVVNTTAATVDFNPPLAGQTLIFSVKVISIQKS